MAQGTNNHMFLDVLQAPAQLKQRHGTRYGGPFYLGQQVAGHCGTSNVDRHMGGSYLCQLRMLHVWGAAEGRSGTESIKHTGGRTE